LRRTVSELQALSQQIVRPRLPALGVVLSLIPERFENVRVQPDRDRHFIRLSATAAKGITRRPR
jgi:hypothetical protein